MGGLSFDTTLKQAVNSAAVEPIYIGGWPVLSDNLIKAHGDVTERTGLLALQPFVDACQVEVVPALGPDLWVVCSRQPESD